MPRILPAIAWHLHDATRGIAKIVHAISPFLYRLAKRAIVLRCDEWQNGTRAHETVLRFLPGIPIAYNLYFDDEIVRCKCCCGRVELDVDGRLVREACTFLDGSVEKELCEHVDEHGMKCTLPGKTCRGTPASKFTAVDLKRERSWMLFKAFKIASIARDAGWCVYHASMTASMTTSDGLVDILVDAGFRACTVVMKKNNRACVVFTRREREGAYPLVRGKNGVLELPDSGKVEILGVTWKVPGSKFDSRLHERFAAMLRSFRHSIVIASLPEHVAFYTP